MNVLVAFEVSGRVRDAFAKKGHNAWSLDILPSSGNHIQIDWEKYLVEADWNFWDLLIAFPPCTHLTASCALHWNKKRDLGLQQKAVNIFMSVVNVPVKMKAIENPVGIISTLYRKPDQYVDPYNFGDNYTKKTCLWLFNLPPLIHTFSRGNNVDQKYILHLGINRSKKGSITPMGLAEQMANQWG